MIQIKIQKEISNYNEKFFGFNSKTVLTIGIILSIIVPMYILLIDIIGFKLALIPTVLISLLVSVAVLFTHNNMSFIDTATKFNEIRKGKICNIKDIKLFKVVHDDGIVETEDKIFSKTFELSDFNYEMLYSHEREQVFLNWCTFLNSFSNDIEIQVTINSRKLDLKTIKCLELESLKDEYNDLVEEQNKHLKSKISEIYQKNILFTISVHRSNINEARKLINQTSNNMKRILEEVNTRKEEPIELKELNKEDFYNEYNSLFNLNVQVGNITKKFSGRSLLKNEVFEDYSYTFINNKYIQSIAIDDIPTIISDKLITQLKNLDFNMKIVNKIKTYQIEDSIKYVKNVLFAAKSDKIAILKKNSEAKIPDDIEEKIESCEALLKSVSEDNQKIFSSKLIVLYEGNSIQELNSMYSTINSVFSRNLIRTNKLSLQVFDSIKECLPIGHSSSILLKRTIHTEGLAAFNPFSYYSHSYDEHGLYYGVNQVTSEPLVIDKLKGLNFNSFILATSGGGKSFFAKQEMLQTYLSTKNDIIIIDPEAEYLGLNQKLQGERIDIDVESSHHINPMEISSEYGDGMNPIKAKSEFLITMLEIIVASNLTAVEKSTADRCINKVYNTYFDKLKKSKCTKMPILDDLYNELLKNKESLNLANALELYTKGSLNLFNNQTNINLNNKLTLFNTKNLGNQLKGLGSLIVLDFVWNRVSNNRNQSKYTNIYIDEIYLLFKDENTLDLLMKYYKRFRKYGGIPTGITQNVEDLIGSEDARKMLSNSHYLTFLNQAPSDRKHIKELFNLSDEEEGYITNSKRGHGLLRIGGHIIPFENVLDKESPLYEYFTSTIGE